MEKFKKAGTSGGSWEYNISVPKAKLGTPIKESGMPLNDLGFPVMRNAYAQKPDFSRCSSREMAIRGTYDDFESDLIKWISECVTHNSEDAENLVCAAPGLDRLYATLRQPGLSNKRMIFANFTLGHLPNRRWVVYRVDFAANASQLAVATAERQRQLDLAEERHANAPPNIRQMVFPAEDWTGGQGNINIGNEHLAKCFTAVYNSAKKDAELPENPFENPLKDARSATDLVVKTVGTHIPGKKGEEFNEAFEKGYSKRENLVHAAEGNIFEMGKTLVENGVGKYLKEAEVPWLGFFEATVGLWFDACISSMAGKVAKVRSHAYVYFTYGFLSSLILADVPQPRSQAEHKYFRGGENAVRVLCRGDLTRFYVQLALLDYARTNPIGHWEFKIRPDKWVYPVDYIRHWSPQRLGRSILTQLCVQKYLVD